MLGSYRIVPLNKNCRAEPRGNETKIRMHSAFQVAVSQTASIAASWRAVFLVRFQNARLDAFTTFFYAFEARDSGNMRQSQYGIPDGLTSDVSSGR